MVIDAEVNEWVKEQFSDTPILVKVHYTEQKQNFDTNTKRNMITQLKLQGTETAPTLAQQIEHEINDTL